MTLQQRSPVNRPWSKRFGRRLVSWPGDDLPVADVHTVSPGAHDATRTHTWAPPDRRICRCKPLPLPARASSAKRGPGEFSAAFGGCDSVRNFDDGLIMIAEKPVRLAELGDTHEAISECLSTAQRVQTHAHNLPLAVRRRAGAPSPGPDSGRTAGPGPEGPDWTGVDTVHTLRLGLGRTGAGLGQIAKVNGGVADLQGLEPGSSPTSGTCFPWSGACGPPSVHKFSLMGPCVAHLCWWLLLWPRFFSLTAVPFSTSWRRTSGTA
jgi:hypothetical protein